MGIVARELSFRHNCGAKKKRWTKARRKDTRETCSKINRPQVWTSYSAKG